MILLVRLVLRLLADVGRLTPLLFKPRHGSGNLILRRQIALFEQRGMKGEGACLPEEGSLIRLPLGAACQPVFMCTRAQSTNFVNPPGTRAVAAAM
jgi:hypothetical protein